MSEDTSDGFADQPRAMPEMQEAEPLPEDRERELRHRVTRNTRHSTTRTETIRILATLDAERQKREAAEQLVAELRSALNNAVGQLGEARTDREAAKRQEDAFNRALLSVAYDRNGHGRPDSCRYCGAGRGDDHEPDCLVGSALSDSPAAAGPSILPARACDGCGHTFARHRATGKCEHCSCDGYVVIRNATIAAGTSDKTSGPDPTRKPPTPGEEAAMEEMRYWYREMGVVRAHVTAIELGVSMASFIAEIDASSQRVAEYIAQRLAPLWTVAKEYPGVVEALDRIGQDGRKLMSVATPPPPAPDAAELLAALVGAMPRCHDCGAPATCWDPHDVVKLCDACAASYDGDFLRPFDYAPQLRDALAFLATRRTSDLGTSVVSDERLRELADMRASFDAHDVSVIAIALLRARGK